MIYEKYEKSKCILLKPDEYRIAEKDIEIKNHRDGILVIDRGTVFTAESRFMTNVYEVIFKTFGFAKTIAKYTEPVSVQKVKIQRFAETEYNELLCSLSKDTDSMEKKLFEQKLLQHNEVRECTEKIEALRERNYQIRLADTAQVQRASHSGDNSFSDIIFRSMSKLAAKLENHPVAFKAVTLLNDIVGSLCIYNILKMFIFMDAFISDPFSLLSLFVNMMLIVLCLMNVILKPIKACEVYKGFLNIIFKIIKSISDSNYIPDVRSRADIAGAEFVSVQQMQLQKTLDEHFPEIAFDIFVSARLQQRNSLNAAYAQKNSMPVISPLGSFSAAPSKETETRTEQEIIGGYERVAFPRYNTPQNSKINGSPARQSNADGRRVINLDKNACTSERKKISLEKSGDRTQKN